MLSSVHLLWVALIDDRRLGAPNLDDVSAGGLLDVLLLRPIVWNVACPIRSSVG